MTAKSRFDQAEKYREMMECAESYVMENKLKADAPDKVANFIRPLLVGLKQEKLFVLMTDSKHRINHCEEITVGLVDRSQVHPREVFRNAIIQSASCIVVAHNHPSGDPTPSSADIACTRQLIEAGKIIGIQVTDHVIVGLSSDSFPGGYVSMRAEKLLDF